MGLMSLAQMRAATEEAKTAFDNRLRSLWSGADEYDWHRAMDPSLPNRCLPEDAYNCLSKDDGLLNLWDDFIAKLHDFYHARDGEGGVLGRAA